MTQLISISSFAGDFTDIYEDIKNDYPDFVEKMIDGGSNEAEIKAFLTDLGETVEGYGDITESNFESLMFDALKEVLFYKGIIGVVKPEHFNFAVVLLKEFADEIKTTLETKKLTGDLLALKNTVKNAVLEKPVVKPVPVAPIVPVTVIVTSQTAWDNIRDMEQVSTEDNLKVRAKEIKEAYVALLNAYSKEQIKLDHQLRSRMVFSAVDNTITLPKLEGVFDYIDDVVVNFKAGSFIITKDTFKSEVYKNELTLKMIKSGSNTYTLSALSGDTRIYITNKSMRIVFNVMGSNLAVFRGDTNMMGWSNDNKIMTDIDYMMTYSVKSNPVLFNDLAGFDWSVNKIEVLASKGIIKGKALGVFDPSSHITRAEVAALLSRMMKLKVHSDSMDFTDVFEQDWYCQEVHAAFDSGLIKGMGNNTFDPNGLITQEEVLLILSRVLMNNGYYSFKDIESLGLFTRNDVSVWALDEIGVSVHRGAYQDIPLKEIQPKAYATRAEVSNMIYEIINVLYCRGESI